MKVKLPSRMVYFKLGRSFGGRHSREVLNGFEEVEGARLDTEDEGWGRLPGEVHFHLYMGMHTSMYPV